MEHSLINIHVLIVESSIFKNRVAHLVWPVCTARGEEFYGKYPITGDVSFGMGYNYKTNVFQVKIGGCRDLVPIDAKKSKSDPWVTRFLQHSFKPKEKL